MELNRDELWNLRQSITLGSLNYSDFENELGLDPHVVAEFFEGYMDFLEEKMVEDGYSDDEFYKFLDEYDNPENLEEWYNICNGEALPIEGSTDDDTGDRIIPDIDLIGRKFKDRDKDEILSLEDLDSKYLDEAKSAKSKKLKEDNTDLTPVSDLEYAATVTEDYSSEPIYHVVSEKRENTLNEAYHNLSDKEIAKTIIDEISETLDAHEEVLNETIAEEGSDGLFAVGTQQLIDSLREILSDLRVMVESCKDVTISKKRLEEATGTDDVDRLYSIIDTLGYEEVLDNIIKWLPNDTIAEIADDLTRDYDLDYSEDEEEEEEEDDEEDNDEFDEDDFRPLWSK